MPTKEENARLMGLKRPWPTATGKAEQGGGGKVVMVEFLTLIIAMRAFLRCTTLKVM